MDIQVFLAVIFSAAFQAGWNFYTKSFQGDRALLLVTGWGISGLILIPAGVWIAGPDAVTPTAALFALGSGTIHTVYVLLLGRAYGQGDLSVVFPVARGGGIAMTCTAAVLVGTDTLSVTGLAGIACVIVGIGFLCAAKFAGAAGVKPGIPAALAVSLSIATYSLFDKIGTTRSPLVLYLGVMNLTPAVLLLPWYCTRRKPELADILRSHKTRALAVSGAGSIAYFIILWALRENPASYVVALREVSIAFAVVLGAVFLKEPLTRSKVAGIATILAGIALIKVA
jgi:drug/metabolite transporter (DMT)-like permease